MAKQSGEYKITGTYDDITFYEMNGQHYAREKSSLTGKRVKKDPAFKRTMALAEIFGRTNKIVSLVYAKLPAKEKGRDVRYSMIRRARKMVEAGMATAEIIAALTPVRDHGAAGTALLKKVLVNARLKNPDNSPRHFPVDKSTCVAGKQIRSNLSIALPSKSLRSRYAFGVKSLPGQINAKDRYQVMEVCV